MSRKQEYASPNPTAYSLTPPVALKTELVIFNQIRKDENTLIWGEGDSEPVRILAAIAESPTTTSCLGKIEQFTKGSGFSDVGLQSMVINKDGQTLWDFHCELVQYLTALDAFAVNFKFSSDGKITNSYVLPTEGCRFVAQAEQKEVNTLKYNPYFGSMEYRKAYTTEFPLYDPAALDQQIKELGTQFQGQVYFKAIKRTLYKHYPIPKYWAGKKWIYSDAKLATYIDELLDNGFFQSAILNVIGDPNKMSKNPDYQKEVVGTDGTTRKEPAYTEGEVFDKQMARSFSGVKKAGTVMALWSLNKDTSPKIEAFPSKVDFSFIAGTLLEVMRMITVSTEVPAILANLPNQLSSLASGGDAIKNSIQLMQANTLHRRTLLEQFYNTIFIPNLQKGTKSRVEIQTFNPVTTSVTVDVNMWNALTLNEQREYVKKSSDMDVTVLNPTVIVPVADHVSKPLPLDPAPVIPNADGTITDPNAPAPVDPNAPVPAVVDENLKNMKVSEINRISSIVKKFETGKLTLEQAKQFLAGYGLSEEQQTAWLNPPTI